MKLHECDAHFECCRLILAMDQAGEKLDPDRIDPGSSLMEYNAPDNPARAAREHWKKANEMVQQTGYHRRDKDVKELDEELKKKGVVATLPEFLTGYTGASCKIAFLSS